MSKGSPSMVALLGLLAVAGFQNRSKISEMLKPGTGADGRDGPDHGAASQGGGAMDDLRGMLTRSGGGGLAGGLTDLLDRFKNPAQPEKARNWIAKADSWVAAGQNSDISTSDLEEALDEDTLEELVQKTGLNRTELLNRLSATLPEAVDQFTPDGRLPTEEEARQYY